MPTTDRFTLPKSIIGFRGTILMAALAASPALSGCANPGQFEPSSVVATYAEGEVTASGLDAYAEAVALTITEEKDIRSRAKLWDREAHRKLVTDTILWQMVKRRIKDHKSDARSRLVHALWHAENTAAPAVYEEIRLRHRIAVDAAAIRRHYEANRELFGERFFYEVRDEVRDSLAAEREKEYADQQIRALRSGGKVTTNFELLRILQPTETELVAEYNRIKEQFRLPQAWVIDQILIPQSTRDAQETANRARALIDSGRSPKSVAAELGEKVSYVRKTQLADGGFLPRAIGMLRTGETTKPMLLGDSYIVARLLDKRPDSYASYESVRDQLRRRILTDRQARSYDEKSESALFIIDDLEFTVGDFHREITNLPAAVRQQLLDYEAKIQYLDAAVDRLVLLDDWYDGVLSTVAGPGWSWARDVILTESLHQSETHREYIPTETEIEEHYRRNRRHYKTPLSVQLDAILAPADARGERRIMDAYYRRLKPGFLASNESFDSVAMEFSREFPQLPPWRIGTWTIVAEDFDGESPSLYSEISRLLPGGFSRPFLHEGRYMIVRVNSRSRRRRQSLHEARAHVTEDLRTRRDELHRGELYRRMLEDADVAINESILKAYWRDSGRADGPR